ncbi:capsule biosynthesis protein (plasmid) [Pedobacter sp. BS3]|uniref:SLBB domain-containing protein n=1 Tax=Pedobacter sp. BS3 TaxID=2567937 RepID=UPI0011EE9F59|nr:SLBB domain-containing protein [Pedobacter sp. BS3]TZF86442.1 capsule biosynthesis protein [Pedobacter sp. BS3]
MNIQKIAFIVCLLTGMFFTGGIRAQSINQQNFSNIKVDELSDDQIREFINRVEASGLSDAQLEQVALSRGMNAGEIQKLRDRVQKIRSGQSASGTQGTSVNNRSGNNQVLSRGRQYNPPDDSLELNPANPQIEGQKVFSELRSKIFGADLFRNNQITFEPNLRLATPKNYVIGPDDELLIDIYGNSEASYKLRVSPEGTINLQYVGIIPVAGMTIEQATSRIRSRMATVYSGLRNGGTSLSIALGNIRSIKVILTGEVVKPGTYTLPSVATVFNALYASGGPGDNGSFRNIEIIRAGQKIATLDIYDFLLKGSLKNNIRLQDQDIIHIPTYQTRVEMVGQVKRPGIFEMKTSESLSDLLRFAGGFNEVAYKAKIKVLKNTDTERKITDVMAADYDSYVPQSGDKFFVDEILDRFENRVTINGAVFRPGQYELENGLTLSQLIKKANGIKEDAFLPRGYITRLNDDNTTQLISFDLGKILKGEGDDIALKREDVVTISSIFDLREEYKVSIDGEVRYPGSFDYADNMTLEDLVMKAGGFKEGATAKRIEVSRRVKNSDATSSSAHIADVYQINIDQDLRIKGKKFILKPFDIVSVRASAGYEEQKQVRVEGEVLFPGTYTITRRDERVSDLVQRAGGFTALAYPDGASLKRPGHVTRDSIPPEKKRENDRLNQFQRLQKRLTDTVKIDVVEEAKQNDYVGINLGRILEKPGSKYDLFLEDGDILTVPKQLQTIKVRGEVLSPVTVLYSTGKGFRQYIANAGGFSTKALKKRAYIIYANGSVQSTKKFLFFNNYPAVRPGAEIFVPTKPERKHLTTGETIGLASAIASLGAIVIGIMNSAR